MQNIPLLEAALLALPIELAVLDRTGKIVFVNEEWEAFARNNGSEIMAESSVGWNYLAVCHQSANVGSELASETLAGLTAVLTGMLPIFTLEYPCHTPHGEQQRWFLLYAFPLPENAGHIVVLHMNITQPKQLVQRLTADNEEMSAYLSLVGHEMRTPLTSVIGHRQLAQRHLNRLQAEARSAGLSTEQLEQRLTVLEEDLRREEMAAKHLDRLIKDMGEVVQIQSGQLELHVDRYDLGSIIQEVVEEQRFLWPGRELRLVLAEQPMFMQFDRDRIRQVVTNYLSNALKYAPAILPIDISMNRVADQARVEVIDHGPGLSPAEQERIWQRFYRGSGAQGATGLGLGLAICRSIILQHGGQVGVESSPGTGANFWFTLPIDAQ